LALKDPEALPIAGHPEIFDEQLFNEEGNDDRDQRNPFYESCSQDHVSPDISDSFRLTSDGFHSLSPDRTYSDSGTDRC
jgi:hypothetical protein